VTDAELIAVARPTWDKLFDRPPLSMGVAEGIVWATVGSPSIGVNGYACIPAEGHPWSTRFPNGEDMHEDRARWKRNFELLKKVKKRNPGIGEGEAVAEMVKDPDYEQYPENYGLDDYVDVHGGVTFHQHPWVGFDTGHAWDHWSSEYDPHGISQYHGDSFGGFPVIHWTPELVAEEAKRLARQIAEIGRLEKTIEMEMEEKHDPTA
jgi:hypothetical protein